MENQVLSINEINELKNKLTDSNIIENIKEKITELTIKAENGDTRDFLKHGDGFEDAQYNIEEKITELKEQLNEILLNNQKLKKEIYTETTKFIKKNANEENFCVIFTKIKLNESDKEDTPFVYLAKVEDFLKANPSTVPFIDYLKKTVYAQDSVNISSVSMTVPFYLDVYKTEAEAILNFLKTVRSKNIQTVETEKIEYLVQKLSLDKKILLSYDDIETVLEVSKNYLPDVTSNLILKYFMSNKNISDAIKLQISNSYPIAAEDNNKIKDNKLIK